MSADSFSREKVVSRVSPDQPLAINLTGSTDSAMTPRRQKKRQRHRMFPQAQLAQ
jgi:hypothetical protein